MFCDGLGVEVKVVSGPQEYRDGLSGFFWGDNYWDCAGEDEDGVLVDWSEQYKSDRLGWRWSGTEGPRQRRLRKCCRCQQQMDIDWMRQDGWTCLLCDGWIKQEAEKKREAKAKADRPYLQVRSVAAGQLERLYNDLHRLRVWWPPATGEGKYYLSHTGWGSVLMYCLEQCVKREWTTDYAVMKDRMVKWISNRIKTDPKTQLLFALLWLAMLKDECKRKRTNNNETEIKRPRTRSQAINFYRLVVGELS